MDFQTGQVRMNMIKHILILIQLNDSLHVIHLYSRFIIHFEFGKGDNLNLVFSFKEINMTRQKESQNW